MPRIQFCHSVVVCGEKKSQIQSRKPLFHLFYTQIHSSIVGSKPLSQMCGRNSNVAFAFRAVSLQPNSTDRSVLLPDSQYRMVCTNYEGDIRSQCAWIVQKQFCIMAADSQTIWIQGCFGMKKNKIPQSRFEPMTS